MSSAASLWPIAFSNGRSRIAATATILIVDDEPLFLHVASLTLRKQGFDVLKAEGGVQALRIIRSQPPIDVVLSDIHMPGMLGMDLVREIARLIPQAACILITCGEPEPQDLPQGVPLLLKPISPSDLIAAVKDAIARSTDLRTKLRQVIAKSTRLRQKAKKLALCEDVVQKSAEIIETSRLE